MLSINTNLSSLIAQNSLTQSTNKLNQAIERMTTGAKINHAKDNAANYSINTNMTTKIGAYRVAEENTAMGMDMVATASENLDQMQNHATRLRALATQARNGTYGAQSLEAIQAEANALTKEIERLYNTAQYNGVKLFSRKEYEIAPHLPQAGKSGFIDETGVNVGGDTEAKYNGFIENPVTYTESRLAEMLASGNLVVLETDLESFTSGKSYLIKDKAQLEHLAELVNKGKSTTNVTFILGEDIDLEDEEWTPIGNGTYQFSGTFDGNGHKISNLKIDNSTANYQALFGDACRATIKNIGLEGGSVNGNEVVGFLVGRAFDNVTISNCYATGDVTGQDNYVGGLVGLNYIGSTISKCYSTGGVTGKLIYTGGLVGENGDNSTITDCYSTANVTGQGGYTGGLVGISADNSTITNSYSTGSVTGQGNNTGGLVGCNKNSSITNSYSTASVTGQGSYIGGLVGYNYANSTISNCYATGDVTGQGDYVGGLVGYNYSNSTISNCYTTGDVSGQNNRVGGLVGALETNSNITNSYATGNVSGQGGHTGGLVGINGSSSIITSCYATGNVIGQQTSGGLVGRNNSGSTIINSYSTGDVTGTHYLGGLIGLLDSPSADTQITGCAAYGAVNSSSQLSGSLIGSICNTVDGVNFMTVSITNCQVMPSDKNVIVTVTKYGGAIIPDYDMSEWLNEIKVLEPIDISTNLQVGVHGNSSSRVNFNTNFKLDLSAFEKGISSDSAFSVIDDFINLLSEKSTMLGSVSNRLDSVLDEITIQYENLVSSRSTIRDVDMAEVSSTYIQQQILQEASATLLATTKNIQYQNVLGLLQSLRG